MTDESHWGLNYIQLGYYIYRYSGVVVESLYVCGAATGNIISNPVPYDAVYF
jgi:hypothetical protein